MTPSKSGFTLIELLVVIVIIGLLAGIGIASFNGALERGRDSKRISDLKEIAGALDRYYLDHGSFPPTTDSDCSGWDATGDQFIQPLVDEGYLESVPGDPTEIGDCRGHDTTGYDDKGYTYYYYMYPTNSWPQNGCDTSRGDYYVLGVGDMEATSGVHPLSRGFNCDDGAGNSRNWEATWEYVVGKYVR